MASTMHPNDTNAPPPYGFKNESLYPSPPPVYSPNFVPSSQPVPIYNQSTLTPVIGVPFLGHNPTQIQCPRCQQQVFTRVQYEIGTGTWLIALGIFVFGGVLGCFLIPFCLPMCQDAVHSCPSCGNIIGRRDLI